MDALGHGGVRAELAGTAIWFAERGSRKYAAYATLAPPRYDQHQDSITSILKPRMCVAERVVLRTVRRMAYIEPRLREPQIIPYYALWPYITDTSSETIR